MTNMNRYFQDTAGKIPVTAVEQPVALVRPEFVQDSKAGKAFLPIVATEQPVGRILDAKIPLYVGRRGALG